LQGVRTNRKPDAPGGRRHELGRWGESIVVNRLVRGGWTVLDRNFRYGHNEIDIVARKGSTVAFVEVKTRSGTEHGHPFASITPTQRRDIARVASAWVARYGRSGDVYRFDAAAVYRDERGVVQVEYVADAWRL